MWRLKPITTCYCVFKIKRKPQLKKKKKCVIDCITQTYVF